MTLRDLFSMVQHGQYDLPRCGLFNYYQTTTFLAIATFYKELFSLVLLKVDLI